jgi:hypothetical protein
VKPLYGFITDSFPIWGMRRRPYLILAGLLGEKGHNSVCVVTGEGGGMRGWGGLSGGCNYDGAGQGEDSRGGGMRRRAYLILAGLLGESEEGGCWAGHSREDRGGGHWGEGGGITDSSTIWRMRRRSSGQASLTESE